MTIELPGLGWQREGYDMYWFVRATNVLPIQQSRYVCVSMSAYLFNRYIRNDLQLGNLKVNCLLLKLYRKLRKIFLSPKRESNPQCIPLPPEGQHVA